ncbi:hypothetical protein H6F96_21085 [Microcoleus sp. FACHB-53]|jgi:hypothetical protein|nr:hypothetical protein [Microcoleus sp. FACHB-53]MBD2129367.1 hypothetical protein [Microcoleus sp. FACHB-1]
MSRLLYEKSVSYKGYLIIPFVLGIADSQSIYSYKLLSELGHKSKLHKSENPVGIYSSSWEGSITVAKEHLDKNSEVVSSDDYFKRRYTYQNNLIIVYETGGKYFYDHYKPEHLNNVAAPKIFKSEQECISWIKQGLDRSAIGEEAEKL